MAAHVSKAKKDELMNLSKLLKQYKVIGIIDLSNYPSVHLQKLKAKFRDKLDVRVSKKILIRLALKSIEKDKPGIIGMDNSLENCLPALILSNEDPFKLF